MGKKSPPIFFLPSNVLDILVKPRVLTKKSWVVGGFGIFRIIPLP